jgi:hypothetical protein
MWPDNETELDFLNFSGVADTVAEIIVQAHGSPISIGVSGAWGVGKSSMIRLIRRSLERRENADFIFVEFNAWLYQGYDDARAALLEVIASKLTKEAEARKKGVEKAKEFSQRINWFRAAKLMAGSAISLSMGMPPIGLIGEILISHRLRSEKFWASAKASYQNWNSARALRHLNCFSGSGPTRARALTGSLPVKRRVGVNPERTRAQLDCNQ